MTKARGAIWKGLKCPSCGGDPKLGLACCQRCLDRTKRNRKKPLNGLCKCGDAAAQNRKQCAKCLAQSSTTSLARRAVNKMLGLCRCGRKPPFGKTHCMICSAKAVERRRLGMAKYRLLVFSHYGIKCSCPLCDINTIEFLTMDHVGGGGRKHMKAVGCGISFYRWIVKNNYPKNLQVLCWNCNCSKSSRLDCPHVTPLLFSTNKRTNYQQKHRQKLRYTIFDKYGGKCNCCGESNYNFLTIEHHNNNGASHRREINYTSSSSMYRWIINNNFPDVISITCWNCNLARHVYGVCPHQKITQHASLSNG